MSHVLYQILSRLDRANIYYRLERTRTDSVMICIVVPGARAEVEVFEDGHLESSIFKDDEAVIEGLYFVEELIKQHTDV